MKYRKSEKFAADGAEGGGAGGIEIDDQGDASPFQIKAINHDNAREAEEVSHLFLRQYGKTFPLKEVYDPQFWYSERQWNGAAEEMEQEPPFASLVAVHGDKMVGHIAVKSCPRSRQADIFLPVIDPDYRRHAIRLSFQFWRCLENLGRKQGWKQIVHYYCSLDPIFQIVAAKCFGSHEVAEIPMIDSSGQTSAVVDGEPPVLTVLFNEIDPSHDLTTIYPPDEQLRILEQIYRSLSIPREFSLETSAAESARAGFRSAATARSQAGGDPYEICVNEALRLKHLRLCPERLGGSDEFMELVRAVVHRSETDQMALVIQLPLEDRLTPQVAKMLKAAGFRFAGILPEGTAGDQILFAQSAKPFTIERMDRHSAEARSIEEISHRLFDNRRAAR